MPDMATVIKELEDLKEYIREKPEKLASRKLRMINNVNDVISLLMLKEQQAVEPTLIREAQNKHYNYYVCPRCKYEVFYEQNYCSDCGVRFLWKSGE